jgi:hypothetical protein
VVVVVVIIIIIIIIIRVIESRRMRWTRDTARIGQMKNVCKISVTSHEKTLRRPKGRWKDNITMNL